ncbi:uncharacterized protein C22orf15 homolog [Panthera tigris]|uniref:uncharacterized protein C22orf15 homolog n=1 Tax=Panthera tigris TaxID=9694 RepID=UPI001C6F6615|nr:uncharacterized protein C22orf15 homolog [Panthera tigris]
MVRGHGGVLGRRGQESPGRGTSPCLAFLPALPATIALLAEDGHLVSLDEGASQAPSMGSPLLQERGTYVLVQIIKGDDGAPTRYESLLENLDDQCPELAEELRCLSGLQPTSDGRRRHTSTRRDHQEQGPLSKPRRKGSLPSRTR